MRLLFRRYTRRVTGDKARAREESTDFKKVPEVPEQHKQQGAVICSSIRTLKYRLSLSVYESALGAFLPPYLEDG